MSKRGLILGLLAVVVAVLAVLAVPVVLADDPVDGRAGRAEVRFLEGMIDHHQMALDMAADCLAKATSERVVALCQNVIDAQSAEIALMQGWLLEWYNIEYSPMPMSAVTDMTGGDDMGGMHGMDHGNMAGMPATDPAMMMGMFAGFNRLEGVDYEVAWLESMIDHHDDAIHMSERILERAVDGHAELLALAQQIIDDQSAEIESMEQFISEISA